MRLRKQYLTLAEAADYTGLSAKTMRRLIARGDLPGYRLGTHVIRVRTQDVDNLFTTIPNADTH